MKVAVITPYHGEPDEWLEQCHDSVRSQTHPCQHIFIADGKPNQLIDRLAAQHIINRRAHGDFGDTPRAMGAVSAIGQGFDAIAFLDADNWYKKNHIELLLDLHRETNADVLSSARAIYSPAGEFLSACPLCDGETHVDTNCYLLMRNAFPLIFEWVLLPKDLHAIGDRIVWHKAKQSGLPRAHSWRAGLCYRASTVEDYLVLGRKPPADVAKNRKETGKAFAALIARGGPDLTDDLTKRRIRINHQRVVVDSE